MKCGTVKSRSSITGQRLPTGVNRLLSASTYAMLEDGKIVWGLLYPEPGNVFTVYAEQFHAVTKAIAASN